MAGSDHELVPTRPPAPKRPVSRTGRLVVVANRLPVRRVRKDDGEETWERSPGGLVSALAPLLQDSGGHWIGWPGVPGPVEDVPASQDGIAHGVVPIGKEELETFYFGFSNSTIWPLYHDNLRPPEYHRAWWRSYHAVNRRYADATVEQLARGDVAWIHDYQLQLVPGMVRQQRPDARIGFFLHIPFPPVELFAQIPWREEILEGLLGADLIGFQTRGGVQNFLRAVRKYTDAKTTGASISWRGREVQAGAFPISIDVEHYDALSREPAVREKAAEVRRSVGESHKILLGVDRLDYTKGIDYRLRAFETLLERRRQRGEKQRLSFLQVAVPSRESVDDYADMRERVERLVGHIDGAFAEPGYSPVVYHYKSLPPEDLMAYYLAADVMVVTPLRDGMNLVAKEFVAARTDRGGVLVLSEFCGAAAELKEAIQVNPHALDRVADALEQALAMPPRRARRHMSLLRRALEKNDVKMWARRFFDALS